MITELLKGPAKLLASCADSCRNTVFLSHHPLWGGTLDNAAAKLLSVTPIKTHWLTELDFDAIVALVYY